MNPLVSFQWLADRLDDCNTIIFDASLAPVGQKVNVREKYQELHIVNALFFEIDELSDQSTHLPHMLPSPSEFSRILSQMGASHDMDIVIYEQDGVFSAPRAWWMFKSFGIKNVFVLDGSFKEWMKAGLPTHSEVVSRTPAQFKANLNSSAVKNFNQIQKLSQDGAQILDARSAGRFAGTRPEPRPGLSSGHMPGAINIPFCELIKDGRLKPAEELRSLFATKGVDLTQPITTSCGSGVTAAVLALGLEIAGAKQVSLYDGSWAEYASRPEAIIRSSTSSA